MTETTEEMTERMAERMAKMRAARKVAKHEPDAEAKAETPVNEVAAELPSQPTTLQKVAINAEDVRLRKIEALKAARLNTDTAAEPMVEVRVLKRGDGKISMGEHFAGLGELTYAKGESFRCPKSTADIYEDLGFVET